MLGDVPLWVLRCGETRDWQRQPLGFAQGSTQKRKRQMQMLLAWFLLTALGFVWAAWLPSPCEQRSDPVDQTLSHCFAALECKAGFAPENPQLGPLINARALIVEGVASEHC